jgi:hypothetical protein
MCKYFTATDEFAVKTTHDIDPEKRGTRLMPGLMKAMVTIYEPNDDPHPSLPTLREFLATHTDPESGLVSYNLLGPTLTIDPTPLLQLPPEYLDYRVGPGLSFVTDEALAHARSTGSHQTI